MSVRSERPSAAPGCAETVRRPHLAPDACDAPAVAVVRTPNGWSVVSPSGEDAVDSLVEGLSLADLVGEEFGQPLDPDRSARRSARGPAAAEEEVTDPRDARIAALERTVAQLEHALAARVSTERAIGVLAERGGISPRTAFEGLRQSARSSGRPVHELANEVLASLADGPASPVPAPDGRGPGQPPAGPGAAVSGVPAPVPRPPASFPRAVEHAHPRLGAAGATGDGRR